MRHCLMLDNSSYNLYIHKYTLHIQSVQINVSHSTTVDTLPANLRDTYNMW